MVIETRARMNDKNSKASPEILKIKWKKFGFDPWGFKMQQLSYHLLVLQMNRQVENTNNLV